MRRLIRVAVVVAVIAGASTPSAGAAGSPPAPIAPDHLDGHETLHATLKQLLEEALQRNPGVMAKKAAYDAARGRARTAWLPDDPEAGVDVEGQSRLLTFDRTDNEYMLVQRVPFPLKLFLRGRVASKDAAVAYQRYKEEEREVIWHIEQPFYELYVAQQTLAVLEETRLILERMLRSAQARYEANVAPQQDVLKAQIELSKLSIERFNWEQKAHLAEAHFSHILARPLSTRYELTAEPSSGPLALTHEELERMALTRRPELLALALGIQRAKANLQLAATAWMPDLTGRIEARQFSGEGSVREYDTFLGVTVPVWSVLKGLGGEWRSARREAQEAEAEYEQMKNEVLLAVHEADAKVKTAEHAVETYEHAMLPQAKQQVEVALSAYEAGRADVLALIDAERMLKDIQTNYYAAKGERELGLSSLRRAVGSGLPSTESAR